MINKKRFVDLCKERSIAITDEQAEKLDIYAELLVEWNNDMNLTAITQPNEIEIKHFLDCIIASRYCASGDSVADIGTGAGFPGVVMKLMRPDIEMTLIDSQEKRLGFLEEVCSAVGISCNFVHLRAEDAGRMPELRERFTMTTARAVAPLNILTEYCLPLTAIGGRMLAMKGKEAEQECESAANAIKALGGGEVRLYKYALPDDSARALIELSKVTATDMRYPRRAAAIKRAPL